MVNWNLGPGSCAGLSARLGRALTRLCDRLVGVERSESRRFARTKAIFVAPHMDDAALSCGGLVAHHVAADDHPIVVTVFAGVPQSTALTVCAQNFHAAMGMKGALAAEVVRARRAEDEAAMKALGADHVWLDYAECLYRSTQYTETGAIFGPLHSGDAGLLDRIIADLKRLWDHTSGATVHVPLGVGEHVDHRLCFGAAWTLRDAGAAVSFYEDFPYVAAPDNPLGRRLSSIHVALEPKVVDVTEFFDYRTRSMACYTSQLRLLTPSGTDPMSSATSYATKLAASLGAAADPGRRAERFWSPVRAPRLAVATHAIDG